MRLQARQLLTDPAVAREFERLRGVAEAKAQEVRKLQEELQAVNFSQDSKAGRLLMAKCRALQVRPLPFALLSHVLGTLLLQRAPPKSDLRKFAVKCTSMAGVKYCKVAPSRSPALHALWLSPALGILVSYSSCLSPLPTHTLPIFVGFLTLHIVPLHL